MAKKRGAGGSSLGLIVTLVFFILTTVILGVTTYMGYNEIEKEKETAKKAKGDVADMEKQRNWWRFQTFVGREYMGEPMGGNSLDKDQREILLGDKKRFDGGQLDYAQKDREEVKAFMTKMQQEMPWGADEKSPGVTYVTRLAEKDKVYTAMAQKAKDSEDGRNRADQKVKELDNQLKEEKEAYDKSLAAFKRDAAKDRDKDREDITKLSAALNVENQDKLKEKDGRDAAEKRVTTLDSALTRGKGELAKEKRDKNDIRDEREKFKVERDKLLEKTGGDVAALEAEALDAKSLDVLKNWPDEKKKWQIIRLDQKGTMPYINLGTADGLQAQMTFSLHSMGLDKKLSLSPKGTVEVVQVLGPNLSRVRVTSVKDPNKEPVVAGDRLFNPTWDPNQPHRIAIAGLVDLGGEGVDSSDDLRRLLKRQNVVVDAYIDTKNDKQPEVKNDRGEKGDISNKTEYLILGDSLETVRHDKVRDKEYTARFDKLVTELKEKAKNNGVIVIQLRRYLEMIGYKPTKPAAAATPGSYGR